MEDGKQDQFDRYFRLATFRMEVRKERRHHEWRVSFGIWFALAAGMTALKDVHIPGLLLLIFLLVAVVVHGTAWVGANRVRNERDAKRGYYWLGLAEGLFPEAKKAQRLDNRGYDWLINKAASCRSPLRDWLIRLLKKAKPYRRWWEWLFDAIWLFEFLITVFLACSWLALNWLNEKASAVGF
jgi:hypothetical protein